MKRRTVLACLAAGLLAPFPALAHGTGGGSAATDAAPDPLAGRFGGPFVLTAHDGRRVSDTDFRGRFMLVYFGFTHCVDVCPIDLAIQHRALLDVGELAERVQPLFVTVDPERDTPEVLKAYLADFHPATIGLTGSEAEIAAVAKAYRVRRRKVALTHPDAAHLREAAGSYIVDHGSLTFLMDPDGAFRTLVPHDVSADRLTAILRDHLVRE